LERSLVEWSLMRYRVDVLAARSGVSVDTVRFYQGKGLLPPPQRDGRVAWYSDAHLGALRRIRELKSQGFNLGSIRKLLAADPAPGDGTLVSALGGPPPGESAGQGWLTLDELAESTGVSPPLLEAIEREGLLVPTVVDGAARYTESDARALASGLKLLEAGIPLHELLGLARSHGEAMREIADRAVELFDRYVRRPLRASEAGPESERQLVIAFNDMFPAATTLVAHHFGRLLLQAAQERMKRGLEAPAVERVAHGETP
jgi:DNA-binding transcriptional MerR regulator